MPTLYGRFSGTAVFSRDSLLATPFLEIEIEPDIAECSTQALQSRSVDAKPTFINLPDSDAIIGTLIVHNESASSLLVAAYSACARSVFSSGTNVTAEVDTNTPPKLVVTRTDANKFTDTREGWQPWQKGHASGSPAFTWRHPELVAIQGFGEKLDGAYSFEQKSLTATELYASRNRSFRKGYASGSVTEGGDAVQVVGLNPSCMILPPKQATVLFGVYLPAGLHVHSAGLGGDIEMLSFG